MTDSLLAKAIERFERAFGRAPNWAAFAPGRVNLIGEHTDYNDGFVLPIAVQVGCAAVLGPGQGERSRVISADVPGEAVAFDSDPWTTRGSWAAYAAGSVATASAALGIDPTPVDLAVASDVPLGGGLSSSAALEVSVATAVESMVGRRLGPMEKAKACQRAEHEFAGVPCGIMDQVASVMGRRGHALLIDCRSLEITPVEMPGDEDAVLAVVDSRVAHTLASGEYAKRREACERAARTLGVEALRDATAEQVAHAGLSDEERRCAAHVVSECGRVQRAARALGSGDLPTMGRLMLESHASLRDDYRVSCAELDLLVDLAMRIPGVLGARMTGGGFGGSIVALMRPDAVGAFREAVSKGYQNATQRRCEVLVVHASVGASAIPFAAVRA